LQVQVEQDQLLGLLPLIEKSDVRLVFDHCGRPSVANGLQQKAFQALLASELDRLKVDYDKVVSGHGIQGRDATRQDLMIASGKLPPPAAPAAPAAAPARGQN